MNKLISDGDKYIEENKTGCHGRVTDLGGTLEGSALDLGYDCQEEMSHVL